MNFTTRPSTTVFETTYDRFCHIRTHQAGIVTTGFVLIRTHQAGIVLGHCCLWSFGKVQCLLLMAKHISTLLMMAVINDCFFFVQLYLKVKKQDNVLKLYNFFIFMPKQLDHTIY